ncbi:hypothetical protein TUM4438_04110 [Shewanella sairae]|uniref:Periplasmic protein n=1 Tax=Shewanella sairae TaxID=190310 RepID=A0ABQ4P0S7_9GAMM|nr:hypothetical protein [Shewanella sairae]MCL1129536.1 hypothetical protein [Shewanella sairae]GIU41110.1 hypothetical protein TUM4438_04110 [Shewanella sairae]
MIKPRLILLSVASLFISTTANASLESQLSQCAAIKDKLDRLICYDNLSSSLDSQAKTSVTTEAIAVAASTATVASTVESSIEDNFGKVKKAEEDEVSKIYLEVNKVTKDPYGALKITFNNGQVWKQTDSRSYRIKAEQKVFIEKAALGSFMLGTDDRNTTIRVKRLK